MTNEAFALTIERNKVTVVIREKSSLSEKSSKCHTISKKKFKIILPNEKINQSFQKTNVNDFFFFQTQQARAFLNSQQMWHAQQLVVSLYKLTVNSRKPAMQKIRCKISADTPSATLNIQR